MRAQDSSKFQLQSIGIEAQAYPAGLLTQATVGFTLSEKGLLFAKFGYNLARRQDFGKHDNEEGGGFGWGVAYRQYLREGREGWFLEGRTSLWYLKIDWRNNLPLTASTTNITVLQPTLAFGYGINTKDDKIKLSLLAGFGYEINVKTTGDPVGEGGISLIGASISFQLN